MSESTNNTTSAQEDNPAQSEADAVAQEEEQEEEQEEAWRTVCISNLSDSLKEDQLRDLFKACGDIQILCIKLKFGQGRVCYIRFDSNDSAQTALLLNDKSLDSKPLQISLVDDAILANYKEPTADPLNTQSPTDPSDQQQTALQTVHSMSVKKSSVTDPVTLLSSLNGTDDVMSSREEEERQEKLARTIYVGNLNPMIQSEHLSEFFGVCGSVNLVKIAGNSTNPQAARYGFVEFEALESARSAYNLSGHFLLDRPIKIGPAKNAILNPHPSKANIQTNPVKINHAMAKVRLLQKRICNRYQESSSEEGKKETTDDQNATKEAMDVDANESSSRSRSRSRSRSDKRQHKRKQKHRKNRDRDRERDRSRRKKSFINSDKNVSKRNDIGTHAHRSDRRRYKYNSPSRSPPLHGSYRSRRQRRYKYNSRSRSRSRSRKNDKKERKNDKKHKKKKKKKECPVKDIGDTIPTIAKDGDTAGKDAIGMISPRSGMIWDGFQWHPAPNINCADYRASKFPPHLLNKRGILGESNLAQLAVNSPNIQQAAALAACGTKLNTKYPPNPMNACPLVNPDIAAACAAAAAAAGKLTPQQATILKLATVNKTAAYLGAAVGTTKQTEEQTSIMAHQLSTNAVQQQMTKFFPSLINKND